MNRRGRDKLSDAAEGFLVRLEYFYPNGIIWDSIDEIAFRMRRSTLVVYQRMAELKRFKVIRRGICGAYYCPSVTVSWIQERRRQALPV